VHYINNIPTHITLTSNSYMEKRCLRRHRGRCNTVVDPESEHQRRLLSTQSSSCCGYVKQAPFTSEHLLAAAGRLQVFWRLQEESSAARCSVASRRLCTPCTEYLTVNKIG